MRERYDLVDHEVVAPDAVLLLPEPHVAVEEAALACRPGAGHAVDEGLRLECLRLEQPPPEVGPGHPTAVIGAGDRVALLDSAPVFARDAHEPARCAAPQPLQAAGRDGARGEVAGQLPTGRAIDPRGRGVQRADRVAPLVHRSQRGREQLRANSLPAPFGPHHHRRDSTHRQRVVATEPLAHWNGVEGADHRTVGERGQHRVGVHPADPGLAIRFRHRERLRAHVEHCAEVVRFRSADLDTHDMSTGMVRDATARPTDRCRRAGSRRTAACARRTPRARAGSAEARARPAPPAPRSR